MLAYSEISIAFGYTMDVGIDARSSRGRLTSRAGVTEL